MLIVKSCDTCVKKRNNCCRVLTFMIGTKRECWAWSDDSDWEKKTTIAILQYAYKKTGNKKFLRRITKSIREQFLSYEGSFNRSDL